jgi:caspase domain-containing protein
MSTTGTVLGMLLSALGLAISWPGPAQAEKRVALLMGNNGYEKVPRLETAINDARALGETLKKLGFKVFVGENQSRRSMSEALLAFDQTIEFGDTALFFFAGHGFEIHGQNYLLPIDVPPATEGQEELVRDAAFAVERIVDRLQARGARIAILVLDACRNNPFERTGTRSIRGTGGLAPMTPSEGVFVVFSAGAKQTALDRLTQSDPDPNSVFTRNFIRELATPTLTLVQIVKRTQIDVKQLAATVRHEQTPAYYDQIVGDVVFKSAIGDGPPIQVLPQVAGSPPGTPDQSDRQERAMSEAAKQLMADLDALAAARHWAELHDRLTDLNPAARDAHWNALVEQAAIGELTPQTAPGGTFAERIAAIERYYPKFPSLSGSPQFLALRASIGLDAFGRCFDEAKEPAKCLSALERFVHVAPVSADVARGAAHLVGLRLNRSASALFFAAGLDAAGGEAVCSDADLAYSTVAALQRPTDWREAKAARTLAERCWDALGAAVVEHVAHETAESYYLRNACPILMERNAITGLRAARCQALSSR